MRREFKGKLCAYCAKQPATTGDHVIGKGFLPERLRANLPQVPACGRCNNAKSEYEHYAMAVFPFGAMHEAGAEVLSTMCETRLANDQKLHRDLHGGRRSVFRANPDGSVMRTLAVPFEDVKALNLFNMIIRGLLWHHSKALLPDTHTVKVLTLTDVGLALFRKHILSLGSDSMQSVSLAGGAFRYQFSQGKEDAQLTTWVLDVYNSFNMCSIAEDGQLLHLNVVALTGPKEVVALVDSLGS